MIDFAKYAGVDDSIFMIKLGMINKLICDKWDREGPLVGVTYFETGGKEMEHNREKVLDVASQILSRIVIK